MKKLLIVGVAALCLAIAAPAMAKVTMGGMITTDLMYDSRNDEFMTPLVNTPGALQGDNGMDRLYVGFPQAHNRLNATYKSDDGKLMGVIEIRSGAYGSKGDNFTWYYGWLDYTLNDMVHFRFGRQPETFAIMVPSAFAMGHTQWTLAVGYGNLHASNGDMLKAYVRFNDNIRMEFAIQDPDNDGVENPPAGFPAEIVPAGSTAARVREENVLPRFDLAVPMQFGKFVIEPSLTYLKQNYDQVRSGFDDTIDIWGASVGARMGFGPVTISMELTYGQNLGQGNYTGAGHAGATAVLPARARAYDSDNDGVLNAISDSDVFMGWIQFDFNFGPATLKLAFGMEDITNDGGPGAADDFDTTRYGYALAVPIKVAKGFTVTPNFIYHDRDGNARDGVVRANNPTVDYGSEWMLGVQFNLKF
jgi:hypothetical protein